MVHSGVGAVFETSLPLLAEPVVSIFGTTGIALDTVFTGKAVLGMLSEMKRCPSRFRGNRILFIHTGRWAQKLMSHKSLSL